MRLKHIFLIISILVFERANACVCFDIDSLTAIELMKEVEFVVIGHAVKNVGFNAEVNNMWDQQNQGFNVLIEIDSVVKGNVNSKTITVWQFGGNCDQIFEFGEQYLIMGNQLERFVNKSPKMRKPKEGKIPPPPPPPSLYSKTLTFYNNSDEEMQFWNELSSQQIILNTSMCSSFYVTSRMASFFLDN